MRIIGGDWRRRKIPVYPGPASRPTPDRVRETLFNWLAPALPGAVCLDLFAGTGVLGLEALSRGAARAVFVERDPGAAAALERVAAALGARAEIVCEDAGVFVGRTASGPFDLVFVDPPYAQGVESVLAALPVLLRPGGHVYLERERGAEWPEPAGYDWSRLSSAGAVSFGLATVGKSSGV